MARNKNQNQYGSFVPKNFGYKKYIRYFVATLTVVIFIFGASLAIYKHLNKPEKQSQLEEVAADLPGWWLDQHFGASVCEKDLCKPEADPDQDKLTNDQEYFYHTNPLSAFTAKDSINDGELVAMGFDPSRSGRMTFDQVTNEDNILGESLLLSTDVQKIVAEDLNIDNVRLPLVKDGELEIIYTESEEVYRKYIEQMNSTIEKYFPEQRIDSIVQVLESGDDGSVQDIKNKSTRLAVELKAIPVPAQLLMYHKYNVALYELVSKVLVSNYSSLSQVAADAWFDNVQAMLALMQKLNFEKQRLIANQ